MLSADGSGRFGVRRQGWLWLAAVAVAATGCTSGEETAPVPPSAQTTTEESAAESVTPPISRDVPPDQRRELAAVADLCSLVSPDELAELAFPVQAGHPRQLGAEPVARGCQFDHGSSPRSVLVAAQPAGYAGLGREEVDLGAVTGTQTLHVNDCTVLAPVRGATLQVAVTAREAGTTHCETAQSVAQYVLAALVR